MTELNNYEVANQNLNDDYNLTLKKQYNEFKEQFERSGDIRANVFREIMNGAPPDAFDDVLKNANKIDTKVNEEKIEAEFRRLFKVRAEDLIRKEAKISAEDVKLQPNKENWTKLQNQLFGMYQAYARDVTNHVDGNPYALKFDDDTLVAPSVRGGRLHTNDLSDTSEIFLNKYIMDNIEELTPTIAKYRYNNDDKFALDRIGDMSNAEI